MSTSQETIRSPLIHKNTFTALTRQVFCEQVLHSAYRAAGSLRANPLLRPALNCLRTKTTKLH